VDLGGGGKDLYILQARFHDQFAADVSAAAAELMAVGQRPVAEAALSEESTEPAWKTVPSWFIFGDKDRNIPPAAMQFMAERARSRQTTVVKGASHVVMVSHAPAVAGLIEKAATSR
jgi:pimeloyl-ACP methyl ester carboxylesterase